MPCLLLFVILLFPRVALVLMWLFTTYLQRPFHNTLLIPLLGFLFLPLTTIVYAWEINSGMPLVGINLLWLLLAVLFDLGGLGAERTAKPDDRWNRIERPIQFMTRLLLFAACFCSAFAQSVPFIDQPLIPSAVKDGGAAFTLTVNGGGFQSTSMVLWNGSAVATTFVNSRKLTALIPAANIASPKTAIVSVSSGPKLVSNQEFLQVEAARPAVAFAPKAISGISPSLFAVADFNNDGFADIVTRFTNGPVEILLGNGDGTFQNPLVLSTSFNEINQFVTGDLNGDGNIDLIIFTDQHPAAFLGNGDGSFQSSQMLPALDGEYIFGVVGDFNGDGKLDLAYTLNSATATGILLGNGDGTFTVGPAFTPATSPRSIATADLNGDGFLDAAISSNSTSPFIALFLNDGAGGMIPAESISGVNGYGQFVLADFNGDGVVDLAAVDSSDTFVFVFLGNGNGTFQTPLQFSVSVGALLGNLITGDFNGDGKLDLIAPWNEMMGDSFSLLLGNGDGTFRVVPDHSGTEDSNIVAADFNGDGSLDLAAITPGDKLSLFLQTSVLANPQGLLFPTIPITTSAPPMSSTVTNTAVAPLTISGLHITGQNPASFVLTSDLCSGATLPSKGSCSFSAAFTPGTTIGLNHASVSISDNARVSPQSVALQGAASALEVSPSTLAFGNEPLEHASPAQIITIANLGTKAQTPNAELVGADPQDFLQESTCPEQLQPGTSCSLLIRFIPTAVGARTATVSILDTVTDLVITVILSGTGS